MLLQKMITISITIIRIEKLLTRKIINLINYLKQLKFFLEFDCVGVFFLYLKLHLEVFKI